MQKRCDETSFKDKDAVNHFIRSNTRRNTIQRFCQKHFQRSCIAPEPNAAKEHTLGRHSSPQPQENGDVLFNSECGVIVVGWSGARFIYVDYERSVKRCWVVNKEELEY